MNRQRRYDNIYPSAEHLIKQFVSDVLEEMELIERATYVNIDMDEREINIMNSSDDSWMITFSEGNEENDDEVIIDYGVYYQSPTGWILVS